MHCIYINVYYLSRTELVADPLRRLFRFGELLSNSRCELFPVDWATSLPKVSSTSWQVNWIISIVKTINTSWWFLCQISEKWSQNMYNSPGNTNLGVTWLRNRWIYTMYHVHLFSIHQFWKLLISIDIFWPDNPKMWLFMYFFTNWPTPN